MKNLITLTVLCFTTVVFSQEFISDQEANSLGEKNQTFIKSSKEIVSRNSSVKSASCSNTSSGTIQLVDCADVGTANFNSVLSSVVDFSSGLSWPVGSPSCFSGAEYAGNWSVYDLATGVSSISVIVTDFVEAGNAYDLRMTFYQGVDCNNLTEIDCKNVLTYSYSSGWVPMDPVVTGLDDTKKLWIFTSCDDLYNLDVDLRGFSTPTNSTCAAASTDNVGCNAGLTGETSWSGPNNNGVTCSGGTWYSNENTAFYTFQATAANATLEVQNTICNDGTNGEAQFGVWESCGQVGNYTSGFLGCAVGVGTLSLPSLTIGNTYIIVVDGQAGDVCTWNFVSTGTNLPVEFISLDAISRNGYNEVSWSTLTEVNAGYFAVEKSIDGKNFFEIGFVDAAGDSQERIDYAFIDDEQDRQTVYYRLRQVDLDGEFVYQGPVYLSYSPDNSLSIVPNPIENVGKVDYFFKANNEYLIEIRGVSGRVIFSEYLSPQSNVFSYPIAMDLFESGLYFLSIQLENGEIITSNFLKN